MDKIKSLISKADWPTIVLILIGLRACTTDFSFGQAFAALVFGGIFCFKRYMDHIKKPDINIEIQAQIEEMKATTSALMLRNSQKPVAAEAITKRFF